MLARCHDFVMFTQQGHEGPRCARQGAPPQTDHTKLTRRPHLDTRQDFELPPLKFVERHESVDKSKSITVGHHVFENGGAVTGNSHQALPVKCCPQICR